MVTLLTIATATMNNSMPLDSNHIQSGISWDAKYVPISSESILDIGNPTPYEIFNEVTKLDSLLDLLVTQSKLYMHQKGKVFDITSAEMEAFLLVVFAGSGNQKINIGPFTWEETMPTLHCNLQKC